MNILFFLLLLVVLILIHEFGHFIVAKAFGIRVDEFGIFFPPRIAAFKKGETEYSLNWLPFGGFVRIFGEQGHEGVGNTRSMASKHRLVQAAVLVAGVAFNFLFAWLLFSAGYMVGLPTPAQHHGVGVVEGAKPTIVAVRDNSPAAKAGLMAEDVVTSLQTGAGATIGSGASAKAIRDFIAEHQDESIIFTVMRGGEKKTFLAKPEEGLIPGRKAVGIELDDIGTLQLSPPLALLQGGLLTKEVTVTAAAELGGFFSRLVRGTADFTNVAGPIGITAFGAAAVGEGIIPTLLLTALISINLGIINLIPIPGLDGGRLLIVAIEGVVRRQVPERLVNAVMVGGFALLIVLMLFVSYHDVIRLLS
jgi:regulator of sigma E protease